MEIFMRLIDYHTSVSVEDENFENNNKDKISYEIFSNGFFYYYIQYVKIKKKKIFYCNKNCLEYSNLSTIKKIYKKIYGI